MPGLFSFFLSFFLNFTYICSKYLNSVAKYRSRFTEIWWNNVIFSLHSQRWPQMIRHAILNLIYGRWRPILWPWAWTLGWQKPILENFSFPSRWGWLMERFFSNWAPKSKLLCSLKLKMEYRDWLFLAPNDYRHWLEFHHHNR